MEWFNTKLILKYERKRNIMICGILRLIWYKCKKTELL